MLVQQLKPSLNTNVKKTTHRQNVTLAVSYVSLRRVGTYAAYFSTFLSTSLAFLKLNKNKRESQTRKQGEEILLGDCISNTKGHTKPQRSAKLKLCTKIHKSDPSKKPRCLISPTQLAVKLDKPTSSKIA